MTDFMIRREIRRAETIARIAHFGQKNRFDGSAFISHPEAVAASLPFHYRSIGWLHDVIEDTFVTADHLHAARIVPATIRSVEILTHNLDMTYSQYIEVIIASGDAGAIIGKFHDLTHNMKPGCPETLLQRYNAALTKITTAMRGLPT